ncbi:MAG: chromosomal replication initiator protein DnaA [Candidatus Latescibacterota bacterium]|nr:chromosomal replication initiator protein DnaA [Candidatus Latescibacterota bacterium]
MLVEECWEEWTHCLREIRDQINPRSYEQWFSRTEATLVAPTTLRIIVADAISADWLRKHYQNMVEDVVYNTTQIRANIEFIPHVEKALRNNLNQDLFESVTPEDQRDSETRQVPPIEPRLGNLSNYTFDNFVVGDTNRMAFSSAYTIAGNHSQTQYNPLFIFGGPGLGKTHLLRAIENRVHLEHTAQRVMYVTAEEYMRRFIEAIQDRSTKDFKELFRKIDILLVDDVQFLLKGEQTQNEFFHTFNALHEKNCKVVLTCDRSPDKIEDIEERLRSRFKWGLVTGIEQPDLITRIAIIESKAKSLNLDLGKDTVALIANHAASNVREIEGVLTSLTAHVAIHQSNIGTDTVNAVLRQRGRVTYGMRDISNVQLAVSESTGIPIALMVGRSRKQEVVHARYLAIYLAHTVTKDTYSAIGSQFGGRDHSTVLYAIQSISNRLKLDPVLKQRVSSLLDQLDA